LKTQVQNTVYPLNGRCARAVRHPASGWHAAIAQLIVRDFAFLPLTYATPGYLFRGIDHGLTEAVHSGAFGLNVSMHPLAALERDTAVVFVSQDCSDALAVTRLWENPDEAAILVIPAALFANRHAAGAAAVLAFADPGVVFRYPFFSQPLVLSDVAQIIIHPDRLDGFTALLPNAPKRLSPLFIAPEVSAADHSRECFGRGVAGLLSRHAISPAEAIASTSTPAIRSA
jgi:hypothetical protein